MEELATLFGSEKKVKIMRLFLFNPHEAFDITKIGKRAQMHKNAVRKYVKELQDIDLVKTTEFVDATDKEGEEKEGWVLNNSFRYLEPLHNILIKNDPVSDDRVVEKMQGIGDMQLIILSGVFLQKWNARVDMLVVGANINEEELEQTVRDLESEVGKELTYAFFTPDEFSYRQNVYDKLIRDVLDYPHKKVLNRLELESAPSSSSSPNQ